MNDNAFLRMMIDRAEMVLELRKRGRRRKAREEYHAIYRDIDFYCRNDTASIAMYEKIMLYYLEEKPALQVQGKRRNSKRQRSKRRHGNTIRSAA